MTKKCMICNKSIKPNELSKEFKVPIHRSCKNKQATSNKNVSEISEKNEIGKDSIITSQIVNVQIQPNDLVQIIIDVWRLEKKISESVNAGVDFHPLESLRNSIERIIRYLKNNQIEIINHTGQLYNYGRNIDVLYFEKDEKIQNPIIKNTLEPSILFNDEVIHRGKVIVVGRE